MQYIQFRKIMGGFTVFSLVDIRQADPLFHRRRLNEWQDKGYLKKVIKGYYIFADLPIDMMAIFTRIALSLRSTLESIATPCSVKT